MKASIVKPAWYLVTCGTAGGETGYVLTNRDLTKPITAKDWVPIDSRKDVTLFEEFGYFTMAEADEFIEKFIDQIKDDDHDCTCSYCHEFSLTEEEILDLHYLGVLEVVPNPISENVVTLN